jgi:hypothetical protein
MIIDLLLKFGVIKIKAYQFKVLDRNTETWSDWRMIEMKQFHEILVYIELGYKYQTRCLYNLGF